MKDSHLCPDPFADKVKCGQCKCWVDKSDASQVTCFGLFGIVVQWYCPTHKKPYSWYTQGTPTNSYYGEVSMTADGVPVGYKKTKDSQD